MDDLMSKLQNILSSKEGQEQLKNIQNMLSNSGNNQANNKDNSNSGFDISSLTNMLSSMNSTQKEQPQNNDNANGNGLDMSSIMAMLNSLNQNSNNNEDSNNNNDSNNVPNIDMNMIMTLQKAFSSMNTTDKNSQLLLALKPHFSDERSKKVDQAISIMRLLSMMPLLKESGLFSGL